MFMWSLFSHRHVKIIQEFSVIFLGRAKLWKLASLRTSLRTLVAGGAAIVRERYELVLKVRAS